MATIKESSTKLNLRVATGTSADGKTVFANRTLSDVNPTLSNDDFVSVASGLGSLQSHTVASLTRVDNSTFEEV